MSKDSLTPEQRTKTMRAVKGRDTGPEVALRTAFEAMGIKGWLGHDESLPGKPDFSFPDDHVAVFVDGGFWHGRPDRYWMGRSGSYWDAKIARNMARDVRVNDELRAAGWTVIRLWDSDVLKDPEGSANRVLTALGHVGTFYDGNPEPLARAAEAPERYDTGS